MSIDYDRQTGTSNLNLWHWTKGVLLQETTLPNNRKGFAAANQTTQAKT